MKKASFLKGLKWLNSFFITCLFISLFFSYSSYSYGKNKLYLEPAGSIRYSGSCGDDYEKGVGDNTHDHATPIIINDPNPQFHNFRNPNDVDWIIFHAYPDREYIVSVEKSGKWDYSLKAGLYDQDGNPVLDNKNKHRVLDFLKNSGCKDDVYICPAKSGMSNHVCTDFLPYTGFYFLKFEKKNSDNLQRNSIGDEAPNIQTDGNSTEYGFEFTLSTSRLEGPTGTICGRVLHRVYPFIPLAADIFAEKSGNIETYQSASDGTFFFLNLSAGDYRLYAQASGYYESERLNITVKPQSVSITNLFLSPNSTIPNGLTPEEYCNLYDTCAPPYKYIRNSDPNVDFWITLHTGMNLFSCPCEVSEVFDQDSNVNVAYNSNCFLLDVNDMIYQYYNNYQREDLPLMSLRMSVRRYADPNTGQWQVCSMDTNQSIDGQSFDLKPDESYLVYIDIQGPLQNLKKLLFPFSCAAADPNKYKYDLKTGINLIGFSKLPAGYDSTCLFEDSNLKNKLESMFHYKPRRGTFNPLYRMFGQQAGHSCGFTEGSGYIFFMREDINEWMPE